MMVQQGLGARNVSGVVGALPQLHENKLGFAIHPGWTTPPPSPKANDILMPLPLVAEQHFVECFARWTQIRHRQISSRTCLSMGTGSAFGGIKRKTSHEHFQTTTPTQPKLSKQWQNMGKTKNRNRTQQRSKLKSKKLQIPLPNCS